MAEEKPCDSHNIRIKKVEADTEKQWEAINELRKRPPIWCTAIISLLSFLLGAAITYAGLIGRAAT